MQLGFGVAAGLEPGIAGELAALCAKLGYSSMWSNDHPAASGLETLAAFAKGTPELDLGVGALALDRHTAAEIAGAIERLKLKPERLVLAFGAGFTRRPLDVVREGVAELRKALPAGVRIQVAAMGPKMCSLAGEIADGAMLNWMTPERAAWAREHVHEGAVSAGRDVPTVVGYVRVAVDSRAQERLVKEERFYRELHDGYRRHFEQLGARLGTVGVAESDPPQAREQLRSYDALDLVVVRALASASLESMAAVARAASLML